MAYSHSCFHARALSQVLESFPFDRFAARRVVYEPYHLSAANKARAARLLAGNGYVHVRSTWGTSEWALAHNHTAPPSASDDKKKQGFLARLLDRASTASDATGLARYRARHSLDQPPWPGFCATTEVGEGAQCAPTDRKGSWPVERRGLADCRARCERCPQCAFVSFQDADGRADCSWFAECPRIRSGVEIEGYTPYSHTTWQVRPAAAAP